MYAVRMSKIKTLGKVEIVSNGKNTNTQAITKMFEEF